MKTPSIQQLICEAQKIGGVPLEKCISEIGGSTGIRICGHAGTCEVDVGPSEVTFMNLDGTSSALMDLLELSLQRLAGYDTSDAEAKLVLPLTRDYLDLRRRRDWVAGSLATILVFGVPLAVLLCLGFFVWRLVG